MRLSFLLLALVAAATAVPQLRTKAGNVDALKKQRDMILLLDQLLEDIKDPVLKKLGYEYKLEENLLNYRDQGAVKYLCYATKIGYIQRKGSPYTVSISNLRREVAALTRTFLGAKDYITFLKTAAWARCYLNEAQFVKAFVAALLQRPDTRDVVVLPPAYEVFPQYFFDARIIRKAQNLRAKCFEKTGTKDFVEIPVDYTAWLPKGEDSLAYFTQDVGLNSFYGLFRLARWMLPKDTSGNDETALKNFDCDRCEIGRGSQYYYIHQQLLARYNLERLSNNLGPIKEADFAHACTPFKPHLSYLNGLEFPGRGADVNLLADKKDLAERVWQMERRLISMIEKNAITTNFGDVLTLYDRKGLNTLGNLIEATGRSINPRYYGFLDAAARELLGGGLYSKYFYEPTPSVLEIDSTAMRDPIFYKLFKRVISLFRLYQESLPVYKAEDLVLPGVIIKDVKFDKLVTYCDKFKADIDSATIIGCEKDKKIVKIEAVVDRLNHKPYDYEIVVESDKFVKGAVVRLYMGPKFDADGKYIDIKDNRLDFVELDQFIWDIKEGKTIIKRKSIEAPMRSLDPTTKKDLLRKVEDALNSHEPFYYKKIAQISGFPERLALPKGKRDGFPVQMVVIISSPLAETLNYDPVLPLKYQTWDNINLKDFTGDYTKENLRKTYLDSEESLDDTYRRESGERDTYRRDSGERLDRGDLIDRRFLSTERRMGDRLFGMIKDRDSREETTRLRETLDTDSRRILKDETLISKNDYLNDYYKDKKVFEMMGGIISLDGRPLGYPLNRPLTEGCLLIPNVKVFDLKVYYEGKKCRL